MSGGTLAGEHGRPSKGQVLPGIADARSLPDLAELLRALRRRDARERASSPLTYRELASKTGWSFTVISDYFAGRVLPPTDRFDDLVQLIGATPAEQGALATARDRIEERRRRSGTAAGGKPAPRRLDIPRQLPATIRHFTGRVDELAILDRAAQSGGTVVISAVEGTAGVGKTTLAVHWAHQVRDRFPDGQLHVNLRGFDPTGQTVQPADALRGFLTALGVPPQSIPVGVDDRAALYRSLVADKQMLVVLDNARDAQQVRPLLPGTAGCMTVVTSRNQLSGLVAIDGADPLPLALLSEVEARELLAGRLGKERTAAEPEAVDRIVAACARLPLALAIVAARAAAHPGLPLRLVADRLSDTRGGLDAFTDPDPVSDARAVFHWSYRALDPAAARLFRLLGSHPGPEVSVAAAASLTAEPIDQAREALTVLTTAHLLTEPAPGRYALHDLLRAYAAELGRAEDSNVERSAALDRMLDHYLHTANGIAALVYPSRPPISLAVPAPGAIVERLTDRKQGLAWLAAEHQVLVAGVELAAGAGQDFRAWALASSISEYLHRQGLWTAVDVRTQEIACEAATRLADPAALAYSQRRLGAAWIRLGRADKAIEHMREALVASSALGDSREQGAAHLDLAFAYSQHRRYTDALRESQSALDSFRVAGRRRGEALALNAIGWYHTQLGNHEQAIVRCEEAIAIMHEIDDLRALGHSHDSLGYAHHQLGNHERAIACFQKAIGLFADFSDKSSQAESMTRLGDVQRAMGEHEAARAMYEQALAILVGMGHPGATLVQERLGDESRDDTVGPLDEVHAKIVS